MGQGAGESFESPMRLHEPARRRSSPALVVVTLVLVVVLAVLQRPSLTGSVVTGGAGGAASAMSRNSTLDLLGPVYFALDRFGRGTGQGMAAQSLALMDKFAESAGDRLRLAAFAGETLGVDAALERLERVSVEVQTWSDEEAREVVLGHVSRLTRIYEGGVLAEEDRSALVRDLRWFGEIALTHGQADSEAARASLIGRAELLAVLMTVGGLGLIVAVTAGVALLIVFLVFLGRGKVRMRPVTREDSPTMLEMFALLLAGMLAIKGVAMVLSIALKPSESVIGLVALGLQWSLALVVLWPLAKDGAGAREQMGWHRGEGVWKEAACGVCGWLAGLPIVIACALMSLLLMKVIELVTGRPGPPAPENPVLEMAAGTGFWEMLLLLTLVVIWAPVVEETVFRGGLFSWLRTRGGFVSAGLVSAFVFAIIHRYPLPLLPAIMALGFVFAWLREWRGSLIAPITAHFCQNAMAFTVLMILTRLAGM